MLFNPVSQRKERFSAVGGKRVKIYVCGITPYDTTHVGHAFTYMAFDVLVRYLKFRGFSITYVQNVTDIDDDILEEAKKRRKDWKKLGDFWTRRYLGDMKRLGVARPDYYVRATDALPEMKKMIGFLLSRKFAYKGGGNVYFDTGKFPRYGKLSGFTRAQMEYLLKERGDGAADHGKRNALDFVLWRGWKAGEPSWEARWGRGRPGWHIECSAIIMKYLGKQIDIHGGGRDLDFPHHESEIAQSESFTGKRPLARYFMHTAMVMYMGEKMSKSLHNLVMVSDLLERHSADAVRWMLLKHHYRKVWEYDKAELNVAETEVLKMKSFLSYGSRRGGAGENSSAMAEFISAMDDDLDTPKALRLLLSLAEEGRCLEAATRISRILGFDFSN